MASDDDQYDYNGDSGEDCYYSGGEDVDPDFGESFDDVEENYNDHDNEVNDGNGDDNHGYGYGYGYESDDPNFNHYEEQADEPEYGYSSPDNTTMTTYKNTGPTTNNYELSTKCSNYDNQSGSYIRGTVKDSYSSGDYANRGKVGYKDEYKSSSTLRVGDKRGYTEYYKQEKETRVEYNNPNTYSGASKSYKNYGGGSKGYNIGGGGGAKRYKP